MGPSEEESTCNSTTMGHLRSANVLTGTMDPQKHKNVSTEAEAANKYSVFLMETAKCLWA